MLVCLRERLLLVLGSIYVYNEHRGYTAIDRVIEAVRVRSPGDGALIAAIEDHRRDERKPYMMFRRWFAQKGCVPLDVDRPLEHIYRSVELIFLPPTDRLCNHKVKHRKT